MVSAQEMMKSSRKWASAIASFVLLAMALLSIDWVLRSETIPINQIVFEGPFDNVSKEQLEKRIRPHLDENFLVLNLENLRKDIELIPWVYRADVRRKWPNSLHISFSEQNIVASWASKRWVNEEGEVVDLDNTLPLNEKNLPEFYGPAGTAPLVLQTYRNLNGRLHAVELGIKTITLTDRFSWETVLSSNAKMYLGRDSVMDRLEKFISLYPGHFKKSIADIEVIDLRYTNGLAVKFKTSGSSLAMDQKEQRGTRNRG